MQKILLVLLVLSAGFAVSGVARVVSAYIGEPESVSESTTVVLEEERKAVRIVVVPAEQVIEILDEEEPVAPEEDKVIEEEEEEDNMLLVEETEIIGHEDNELVSEEEEEEEVTEIETVLIGDIVPLAQSSSEVHIVPFYSQFDDITPANWKKVSCGIAGVAMLIDFYSDEAVSADNLLQQGIAAGAFLSNAGWTHQGLINLSKDFGLNGKSHSMANLSMDGAFTKLKEVLEEGPVMASVHYTFEPTNPIPHLVVVNGVRDGKVFYNDPAEASGGGAISIAKFQSAWKKRYIEIRPVM